MPFPSTITGQKLLIRIGDAATPQTFTVFCGLTTKSMTRQVNTSDVFLEDCADPDALPQRGVDVTGAQTDLSGEGFYNVDQADLIDAALGESRVYQFVLGERTYQGPAVLINVAVSGQGRGRVTANMSFASDGAWTKIA